MKNEISNPVVNDYKLVDDTRFSVKGSFSCRKLNNEAVRCSRASVAVLQISHGSITSISVISH